MDDLFLTPGDAIPPEVTVRMGLAAHASVTRDGAKGFSVRTPTSVVTLPPGQDESLLAELAAGTGDRFALVCGGWPDELWRRLQRRGAIAFRVSWQERPWLEVGLTQPGATLGFPRFDAAQRPSLSRFASVRRVNRALHFESPLAAGFVVCEGEGSAAELIAAVDPRGSALSVRAEAGLRVLLGLGLATRTVPGANSTEEETQVALQTWEPHDLSFHRRTRFGAHAGMIGATCRFRGKLPVPPVFAPRRSGRVVALPPIDDAELHARDRPLSVVMDARRSIRVHGSEPLSLEQAGEFLHRTARVTRCFDVEGETYTRRPYASGGSLYELEVYLLVARCAGLEPGLYHYDPAAHRLIVIPTPGKFCARTLRRYAVMGRFEGVPQTALIVTARFARIAWKYEGLAYALVLKHVGGLLDQFYLAATAMELAPCALGTGLADEFSAVLGVPYAEESPVGEFLLGARAR